MNFEELKAAGLRQMSLRCLCSAAAGASAVLRIFVGRMAVTVILYRGKLNLEAKNVSRTHELKSWQRSSMLKPLLREVEVS